MGKEGKLVCWRSPGDDAPGEGSRKTAAAGW